MKHGVVLFGHGSRNAAWAEPFVRLREALLSQDAETVVEFAFLELMEPSLPDAIGRLVAVGVNDIVVVPVFISAGSHVREDLPMLLAEAGGRYPEAHIRTLAALGEAPEMLSAIAAYALQALRR